MFDILKVVYIAAMSAVIHIIIKLIFLAHVVFVFVFCEYQCKWVDIYHASCIVGNNGLQGQLQISLALLVFCTKILQDRYQPQEHSTYFV